MAKRMTRKDAMAHIADDMDRREAFKELLKTYFEKYKYVPKQYELEWSRLKDEPHWRKDPKVMAKLRKSARMMARNENEKRKQNEKAMKATFATGGIIK